MTLKKVYFSYSNVCIISFLKNSTLMLITIYYVYIKSKKVCLLLGIVNLRLRKYYHSTAFKASYKILRKFLI